MTNDWVTQKLDLPMRRLGVRKLDLVQMYWNDYGQKGYVDAALYLTDAKAAGKIGAVGLTNFDTKRMAEMVDAGAEISSNQIQFSLLDRRPLLQMTEYCASNGVGLLPYGVVSLFLFEFTFISVRAIRGLMGKCFVYRSPAGSCLTSFSVNPGRTSRWTRLASASTRRCSGTRAGTNGSRRFWKRSGQSGTNTADKQSPTSPRGGCWTVTKVSLL